VALPLEVAAAVAAASINRFVASRYTADINFPPRTLPLINVELSKQARTDAIASLKRYFEENLEPIGDLPAGLLLNYIVEEIGPVIYNKAINDAQARLQQRVTELDGELYAPEFEYWPNVEKKRKKKS
jgi:uncharacterized protein (DUF2164 family)